jgi:serine/threonine protein kinase
MADLSSTRLEDYALGPPLGHGGMAVVYEARHKPTDEKVALKQMLPHVCRDEVYVARFVREVQTSAKLDHENIVGVRGYGMGGDGSWFLALEFCDAGTLVEVLRETPRLPPEIVSLLLFDLLSALACAHRQGVIHRDIKPGNVLLTRAGQCKLGDFGIARNASDATSAATGEVVGTPAYMSPEQALGLDKIDGRSDLFSVGMLAYRLLVGRNPFQSESVATSILRVTTGPSLVLGSALATVPLTLERAVDALVQKDLARRMQSAQVGLELLEPYARQVDESHPDLLARWVAEPKRVVNALLQAAADDELARARALLKSEPARAAVHLMRARQLVPDDASARSLAAQLATSHGFQLEETVALDPRIRKEEAALASNPENPALLRQLVNLHRGRNDPLAVVRCLKQLLVVRPDDARARAQLEELLGEEDVALLIRPEVVPGAAP